MQPTGGTKKVRKCAYCEKELYGREDQKYCNVNCKNNFNSRLRSEFRAAMHPKLPEVIKAIKRNYEILVGYQLQEGKEITVKAEELRKKGFKRQFCTNVNDYDKRRIWKCCMDLCWFEVGENYVYLTRMTSQGSI